MSQIQPTWDFILSTESLEHHSWQEKRKKKIQIQQKQPEMHFHQRDVCSYADDANSGIGGHYNPPVLVFDTGSP